MARNKKNGGYQTIDRSEVNAFEKERGGFGLSYRGFKYEIKKNGIYFKKMKITADVYYCETGNCNVKLLYVDTGNYRIKGIHTLDCRKSGGQISHVTDTLKVPPPPPPPPFEVDANPKLTNPVPSHHYQQFSFDPNVFEGSMIAEYFENNPKKRKFGDDQLIYEHSEIHGILPAQGTCDGGDTVYIFFTPSTNDYMRKYLNEFYSDNIDFIKFGSKSVEVEYTRVGNHDLYKPQLKKYEDEMDSNCKDSHLVLSCLTPPYKEPSLVDVSLKLSGVEGIIMKEKCFQYISNRVKKKKTGEVVYDQIDERADDDQGFLFDLDDTLYIDEQADDDQGFHFHNQDVELDPFGSSELFYDIANNRLNSVKTFLSGKNPCELFRKDIMGFNPLDVAYYFKRNSIIEYLKGGQYKEENRNQKESTQQNNEDKEFKDDDEKQENNEEKEKDDKDFVELEFEKGKKEKEGGEEEKKKEKLLFEAVKPPIYVWDEVGFDNEFDITRSPFDDLFDD